MQVIEITELDKRRSRVRLEDGRSFTLYKGECRQLGLREGEECAEGLLEEIYGKILKTRARKRALHLLERMDHTEAQLRRKLGQGGCPEEIVEDAVAYAYRFHYLDDKRYAENYVRSHRDRKSRGKMRMELIGKGVGKEIADLALEEGCRLEDERELIRRWIEKKQYPGEEAGVKEKQRMYRFLIGKGFRPEDVLRELS